MHPRSARAAPERACGKLGCAALRARRRRAVPTPHRQIRVNGGVSGLEPDRDTLLRGVVGPEPGCRTFSFRLRWKAQCLRRAGAPFVLTAATAPGERRDTAAIRPSAEPSPPTCLQSPQVRPYRRPLNDHSLIGVSAHRGRPPCVGRKPAGSAGLVLRLRSPGPVPVCRLVAGGGHLYDCRVRRCRIQACCVFGLQGFPVCGSCVPVPCRVMTPGGAGPAAVAEPAGQGTGWAGGQRNRSHPGRP